MLDDPSVPAEQTPPSDGARFDTSPLLAHEGVAGPDPAAAPETGSAVSARRVVLLLGAWLGAILVGLGMVAYGIGPYNHEREQRSLLRSYRTEIRQAAAESSGLAGVTVPTAAPAAGSSVAILEIGSQRLQEVVVEGVEPSQTADGPGHVPGTAGPGQPGNSVIVGRRAAFGAPFAKLRRLDVGDEIVVTTRFGQSLYEVTEREQVSVGGSGGSSGMSVDEVYGPSDDDRLTLVTSSGPLPWSSSKATVVVATMQSEPFAPTPQGGRTAGAAGNQGEDGATASVALALFAYGAVMGAAVLLYRRLSPRTAYILAVAPVLAITVIAGETLSRLFPAWV